MSMAIQLDMFDDNREINAMNHRINAIEESTGKVRRGIYARHGELAKKYLELHNRLEVLERNICTAKIKD